MDLKQITFALLLAWLKACILVGSFSVVLCVYASAADNLSNNLSSINVKSSVHVASDRVVSETTNHFKKFKHKPWYTKVNYFASLEKNKQRISVTRIPQSIGLSSELSVACCCKRRRDCDQAI